MPKHEITDKERLDFLDHLPSWKLQKRHDDSRGSHMAIIGAILCGTERINKLTIREAIDEAIRLETST